MRRFILLIVLFLFLTGFETCSDEFSLLKDEVSLIDDYKEVVVVYSNICPQSNLNFIRINRGFAVENFYDENTNPDSIYFDPDEISVIAYKLNGTDTLETYLCRDTLIPKDTSGHFTTDLVPAYCFDSRIDNHENEDNMDIALEIKTSKSFVNAKTSLLRKPILINYGDYTTQFNFVRNLSRIITSIPKNSQIVSLKATCNYFEYRNFDDYLDTVKISFTIDIGEVFFDFPIGANTTYNFNMYNIVFFSSLINSIEMNGDIENTYKRKIGEIYFTLMVANEDMAFFHRLTNSFNIGFHDNPYTYSNIEDGFGFLVSHSRRHSKILEFTNEAKDTIVNRLGEKYFFVK
jgi:hypothetical protein